MNAMHAKVKIKNDGKLSVRKKSAAIKKCMVRTMKRKNASKFLKSANGFSGKSSTKPEEARVMSSTECAMKTLTNTLHWTFKQIHDEMTPFFEMKGSSDASGQVTNVLAPIEEKIAMTFQQDICHVADELKREFCNFHME